MLVSPVVEEACADHDTADNYLSTAEWPVYVFDTVPMALNLIVCNWWYVDLSTVPDNQKDDLEYLATESSFTLGRSCKGDMSMTTLELELYGTDRRL